jgi:hypothetical protein
MANIFKSLSPTDYTITPFPAYYQYSYTYVSGSTSNSSDVNILFGRKYLTSSGVRTTTSSIYELFDSIIQTFYSSVAYASYGITSQSYVPSESVYVVSITQDVFGERVVPGTFSIQVGTSQSYDDGKGNLIASSSGTGSIVGRIFYDKGIAVFKPTSSIAGGGLTRNGLYISSSTSVNVNFTSSINLYENAYKVKIEPTEFLYTFNNPSITSPISGSIYNPIQLMVSGNLKPYVTTIGFYNDNNELLLVAKPSVPIQRTSDMAQTFIVKFDI